MPASPSGQRSHGVEQRRLRILAAAAQCFAKSGVARARIDDVAAAAGVSRALVYNHFGSKEELARQVRDHMLDEWTQAVDRVLEQAEGAGEALIAWLRVNLAPERRPLLTALAARDGHHALLDYESAAGALEEWRAKLAALLRRGIALGEFRGDLDVTATADVVRSLQMGMIGHLLEDPAHRHGSGEPLLRAATELLVAGLRSPSHRSHPSQRQGDSA